MALGLGHLSSDKSLILIADLVIRNLGPVNFCCEVLL